VALLPERPEFHPDHPLGCHRRRISDRIILDKLLQLLQLLRFGCSYEAIADTTCSATTIRRLDDLGPLPDDHRPPGRRLRLGHRPHAAQRTRPARTHRAQGGEGAHPDQQALACLSFEERAPRNRGFPFALIMATLWVWNAGQRR
jgi:hypothetical protein